MHLGAELKVAYPTSAPTSIPRTFLFSSALQGLHAVILLGDHGVLLAKVHWHSGLLHGRGSGLHWSAARWEHLLSHFIASNVDGRFVHDPQRIVPYGLVNQRGQDL